MPSLDPSSASSASLQSGTVAVSEVEILAGRRAFSTAQALFAGSPVMVERAVSVGWHSSVPGMDPANTDGSFALVALGSGLDDLVGEIVRVRYRRRQVFVYVVQTADVVAPLSLERRAFAALSILAAESINAYVAAVE